LLIVTMFRQDLFTGRAQLARVWRRAPAHRTRQDLVKDVLAGWTIQGLRPGHATRCTVVVVTTHQTASSSCSTSTACTRHAWTVVYHSSLACVPCAARLARANFPSTMAACPGCRSPIWTAAFPHASTAM